jgi:Ni,Fe-hydrogenase maturation factor
VAFTRSADGANSIAHDIISRIDIESLPVPAVIIRGEMGPLKTLEIASKFDGLVIVDAASMGEAPGTLRTFDLNDLVLGEASKAVTLLGMKIDSELLFAHKYLGLPPTRIVCIETGPPVETACSESSPQNIDHFQEAVKQAVYQLTR